MLSGHMNLPVVPAVGDLIAFRISKEVEAYRGALPFNGHLRVTDRIISPDADVGVMLALEDLTAATANDARLVIEMFEENHGLFGDIWEN